MTLGITPIKPAERKHGRAAKPSRKSQPDARKAKATAKSIGRWVDELAAGLPDLPPLPADFSRADIYDDHD